MKQTSLYEIHKQCNATMVPFAGWDMPVSYAGTVAEVQAVRTAAGLFDVSHMGEVRVSGAGAFDFVQRVTTNDLSRISPGQSQYSLLLNETGGIIDDIIVYCDDAEYLIVLNAGCKDKDMAWLREQASMAPEVTLVDESDEVALIAVQGQKAMFTIAPLVRDRDISQLLRFHFEPVTFAGLPCVISRTGYTGEDGVEIFCEWADAPVIWAALMCADAVPCGLGARDVLRLEAAYPLYGHELSDDSSPLESGVGWAVKLAKGDFIGAEAVRDLKKAGAAKRLVGLRMDERAIPREGYSVHSATDDALIGTVTSGTMSPTVSAGIAMAKLDITSSEAGTPVTVDIRGRRSPAHVVKLPFYRNGV